MIQTPNEKGPEVDAATLTREEWFFLWAAFGQKPDASLKEASEWHKRSFGMTRLEKIIQLKAGMESLIARGVIQVEKDKDGKPKTDANGQPIYIGVGRIVSRMTVVDPKKFV